MHNYNNMRCNIMNNSVHAYAHISVKQVTINWQVFDSSLTLTLIFIC